MTITFSTQEEFEAAVIKVIKENLDISVYADNNLGNIDVKVTLNINGRMFDSDLDSTIS